MLPCLRARLPVNEIFASIQGEGMHTGTPCLFIRFQGCPVGCPWCDTKHTWEVDPDQERAADVPAAKGSMPDATWARMSVEELQGAALAWRGSRRNGHIVLTGGEPALYDLADLSHRLIEDKFAVQIETSGTHEIRIARKAWVTLSPKIGMPGGFKFKIDTLRRANEIKYPVGKPSDVEDLKELLTYVGGMRGTPPVFVQPLSCSAKATALCVQAASENGWRVSVQVHKVIGVR